MLTVVRDGSLDPTAIVSTAASIEWTERWLDVGGWIMELPAGTEEAAELLRPGAGITVSDEATGEILLSGPVNTSLGGDAQAADRDIDTSGGLARDTITFAGTDDMVWLRDRIALPPGGFDYDDRSGVGSTVIAGYVNANTGGARAIPGLAAIVDPGIGVSVDKSARYDALLDVCREVALLAGIGFAVRQQARELHLDMFTPRDLTGDIRFGLELHNLNSAQVSSTTAAGTVAYVAGQGEGAARDVVVVGSPTGRRIERFIDRRDVPTTGQLSAVGAVWLAENAGALSITADPIELAGARYGTDFRVGDFVSVDLSGEVTAQQVTAVRTRASVDGIERVVTLGSTQLVGAAALLANQSALGGRVSLVERR